MASAIAEELGKAICDWSVPTAVDPCSIHGDCVDVPLPTLAVRRVGHLSVPLTPAAVDALRGASTADDEPPGEALHTLAIQGVAVAPAG